MASRQLLLGACVLGLAGCASDMQWEPNRNVLEHELAWRSAEDLAPTSLRLDALLSRTREEEGDYALQRFYAAYLLAQVHVAGSLDRPFLREESAAPSRVEGIGAPMKGGVTTRPSTNGHLVASVFNAGLARGLYEAAARSGPAKDGVTLLPEPLWNLGVENADGNLRIVLTTAYSRLGFVEEVGRILDRSAPELLELESCLALLDRYGVQEKLRPWVCAMLFDYLESSDEEHAYRFAVAAVEGAERFGLALPTDVVAEIDRWIVDGASVLFVCPQSHTAYIPGRRESPISGVAHMDYVPVERPADEGGDADDG